MGKKSTLILFLVILSLILSLYFLIAGNQAPPASLTISQGQTYEVILTENGFSPQEIIIKPGDLIKFKTTMSEPFWPASDLHPTHGIYPEFDPLEPVDPDKAWTFQFQKSGKWKFHDHLQPVFRGVVIVY